MREGNSEKTREILASVDKNRAEILMLFFSKACHQVQAYSADIFSGDGILPLLEKLITIEDCIVKLPQPEMWNSVESETIHAVITQLVSAVTQRPIKEWHEASMKLEVIPEFCRMIKVAKNNKSVSIQMDGI